MKILYYLHECGIGAAELGRIDSQKISFILPGEEKAYELSVDARERRAFIVFDGELLCGGLPKGATVVHKEYVLDISCPKDQLRTTPDYCFDTRPEYEIEKERAYIELYRYFILLPSCTAVMRKFRDKSLSPAYVIVHVSTSGKGRRVVEWKTTTF